jgi:hypothetical protein
MIMSTPTGNKYRMKHTKKVIVNRWLDGSWHIYHREAGEVSCKFFELSLKNWARWGNISTLQ